MEKIKVKTIEDSTIIDIQVSGAFYKVLRNTCLGLAQAVPLDDYRKLLDNFKNQKPAQNLDEQNMYNLLMLLYEIETSAEKQNKTTEQEIEIPEEDSSKS
jgi:hypothetical protein